MGFMRQFVMLQIIILLLAGGAWAEDVLRYAGATTLQRFFMPEVARLFTADTAINVRISGGNTGPGLKTLLSGGADMAGAGRFLTENEKKQGMVEHLLGWDVLMIIVHEKNPVTNLTLEQLQKIFSGEITSWQEVGGEASPIVVVTNPKGSGMRSAVKKLILKEKDYPSREVVSAIVAASDQHVSMFTSGITALSRSMLDAKDVKTINVDGFEPTSENVASGNYPLIKPLTLVTMGEPKGDLGRFISLVKSKQGKGALQRSFVPAK